MVRFDVLGCAVLNAYERLLILARRKPHSVGLRLGLPDNINGDARNNATLHLRPTGSINAWKEIIKLGQSFAC